MNEIELNAILYYADYLSLRAESIPVTDICKYFFIHGTPRNAACVAGLKPVYDPENQYFKQAKNEYELLKDHFDEDGVISFIDDIAFIRSQGSVDGLMLLKYIHLYSDKNTRKRAFSTYYRWKNNQKHYHIIKDDDGKERIE
jgi:hypothetical protein